MRGWERLEVGSGNDWKWEGEKVRRWEGGKVKAQRKRLEGLEAGKQGSSTRLKGKREGEEVGMTGSGKWE